MSQSKKEYIHLGHFFPEYVDCEKLEEYFLSESIECASDLKHKINTVE